MKQFFIDEYGFTINNTPMTRMLPLPLISQGGLKKRSSENGR